MRKLKQLITKSIKTKLNTIQIDKTAKISALSSGNVSKYEFLTGKDVLSEKDLLERAAELKRFEYSWKNFDIAERVKFRRQKADRDSDEFLDIPDMSPLECG